MSRQSLVLIALAALLTVVIGIALFMLLRSANDGTTPTVPAASRGGVGGLVVTFKLEATDGTSTAGKAGRLIALKVPPGSGLQAGDVLATVPGPVLFPVAGEYSLRIRLEGYQAQDFGLNVQDNRDVVIRLDQTER